MSPSDNQNVRKAGQTSLAKSMDAMGSRRDEIERISNSPPSSSASQKQASPSNVASHDDAHQHQHHTTIEHTTTAASRTVQSKLHLHAIHAHHLKHSGSQHDPNHPDHGLHATASHLSQSAKDHTYLWRARDSRKGRKSFSAPASASTPPGKALSRYDPARYETTPHAHRLASNARHIRHTLYRMCTTFAYWDIAYWSGWAYSMGSILFVMDGAWSFRDLQHETPTNDQLATYGGPICFFIGTLLYQLGAVMAYLEAVNDGSFEGSAMARVLEGHDTDTKVLVDEKLGHFFGRIASKHSHPDGHRDSDKTNSSSDGTTLSSSSSSDAEKGRKSPDPTHTKSNFVYPFGKSSNPNPGPTTAGPPRRDALDLGDIDEGSTCVYNTWVWYPSLRALWHHHLRQIGYVACAIQLFGATLYGIRGIVVLPGILSSLSSGQEEACFWGLQVVASCCFLIAGLMFTLECQRKWYRPEMGSLGWWIGIWAIVGSIGFLWIAITGAASYDVSWAEYQADLGTIWGSSAYLTSSLLQWYESLDKR